VKWKIEIEMKLLGKMELELKKKFFFQNGNNTGSVLRSTDVWQAVGAGGVRGASIVASVINNARPSMSVVDNNCDDRRVAASNLQGSRSRPYNTHTDTDRAMSVTTCSVA